MSKKPVSRRSQRRDELAQAQRRRTITFVLAGVVVVAAIIAVIYYLSVRPDVEGIVNAAGILDRSHAENVEYEDTGLPPMGGTHSAAWLNCGIYQEPVNLPNAVHSLEHGAVWLAYNPELPAEAVEQLRDQVRGDIWVLMAPFPGLEADVVMTAWGVQLIADGFDDDRIEAFIDRYRGAGPEPGAACTGGLGNPQG